MDSIQHYLNIIKLVHLKMNKVTPDIQLSSNSIHFLAAVFVARLLARKEPMFYGPAPRGISSAPHCQVHRQYIDLQPSLHLLQTTPSSTFVSQSVRYKYTVVALSVMSATMSAWSQTTVLPMDYWTTQVSILNDQRALQTFRKKYSLLNQINCIF